MPRETFFMLLFLSITFVANTVSAESRSQIIINEIAWMGTTVSASDEWIELYNNTEKFISFDGWRLVARDGTPKINLSGAIPSYGFYLLERTDDTTVPNILADQIYTGAMGNTGETLELYNNFGNLIDSIDYDSGWLAGDNDTKQTAERKTDDVWQTSQNPGGTPKAKNSIIVEENPLPPQEPQAQTETKDLTEGISPLPQLPPIQKEETEINPETKSEDSYPSGIIINELLPSPEGTDEEEEWIEIFNQGSKEINLSNWKITDITGATNAYVFPSKTIIRPGEFLVLFRPETKIVLNNSGDGLNLIQPNGKILDSVIYESAPIGQSYNRAEDSWVWADILTPGFPNSTLSSSTLIKNNPGTSSQILEVKKSNERAEKFLAAAGAEITKSFFIIKIVLIASVLSILSGIIILFLKKKIKIIGKT